MKARNWLLGMLAVVAAAACTTLTEELPQSPRRRSSCRRRRSSSSRFRYPRRRTAPGASPPRRGPGAAPPPQAPAPPPPQTGAQGCGLPPGNGSGNGCPRQSPSFLPDVESALTQLVQEEPGVFNLNQTQGCGTCYKVVNVQRYITRMPELMGSAGSAPCTTARSWR